MVKKFMIKESEMMPKFSKQSYFLISFLHWLIRCVLFWVYGNKVVALGQENYQVFFNQTFEGGPYFATFFTNRYYFLPVIPKCLPFCCNRKVT